MPDYELRDHLEISAPRQFKALAHPLRHRLLGLLDRRAATVGQLAEALGELKGNVSHHLKVLEAAGLVRVVRTRRVQGGTEHWYGRTAATLRFGGATGATGLVLAAGEPPPPDHGDLRPHRARLPAGRAAAFASRLDELAAEFDAADTPGEPLYGLLLGLYRGDPPAPR
jgi:DNA-binding transcriptional ArsR family regulator